MEAYEQLPVVEAGKYIMLWSGRFPFIVSIQGLFVNFKMMYCFVVNYFQLKQTKICDSGSKYNIAAPQRYETVAFSLRL